MFFSRRFLLLSSAYLISTFQGVVVRGAASSDPNTQLALPQVDPFLATILASTNSREATSSRSAVINPQQINDLTPNSGFKFLAVVRGENPLAAYFRFNITQSIMAGYEIIVTDYLCQGDSFNVSIYKNNDAMDFVTYWDAKSPLTGANLAATVSCPVSIADPEDAFEDGSFARVAIRSLTPGNYIMKITLDDDGPFAGARIATRFVVNSGCQPMFYTGVPSQFILVLNKKMYSEIYSKSLPDPCTNLNPAWKSADLTAANFEMATYTLRTCSNSPQMAFVNSFNGDYYSYTPCGIILVASNNIQQNGFGSVIMNYWCDVPQYLLCQAKPY